MRKVICIPTILKFEIFVLSIAFIFSITGFVNTYDPSTFGIAILFTFAIVLSDTGYYATIIDGEGKTKSIRLKHSDLRICVIDDNGISNGRIHLQWNQIKSARILSFEYKSLGRGRIKREIEMIYFSNSNALDMPTTFNSGEYVVTEVSKKFYKSLKKYGTGKSSILDELVNRPVHWYKYEE